MNPALSGLQGIEDGDASDVTDPSGTDDAADPDTSDDPTTDEPGTEAPVTDLEFELDWLALNAGRDLTEAEQACLTPLVEAKLAAGEYYYDAVALLGECGITPST